MSLRTFSVVMAASLIALQACSSQDNVSEAPRESAEAKKVPLGKNVTLVVQGKKREVQIAGKICLRQGQLEQLLTRMRTKEHEAIIAADIDARDVHTALLAAGAEAGNPVKWQPKFAPPTGTAIKVSIEYSKKGKTTREPANDWIRSIKTKKKLQTDWVFAGSQLWPDPLDNTKPPFYAANEGDVICISNFDTALLDVPIDSSKSNDDLAYEANTDAIPDLETPVVVILEPVLPAKKKE